MPIGAWSKKDERQYKAIVTSCASRGRAKSTCTRIAAATVNKRRVREGRAKKGACQCPAGSRRMKSKTGFCYNPKTRRRRRMICR